MNQTYTPEPCIDSLDKDGKEVKALFQGEVVLRIPAYEERLEIVASTPEILEVQDLDEGQLKKLSAKERSEQQVLQMKALIGAVKWSYNFYEKIDITRKKDKKKYGKIDDLKYDNECAAILNDIALKLTRGFDLGNA